MNAFLRSRGERQFRKLYRAHAPAMLRAAHKCVRGTNLTADDVVQEAWIRAVRSLPLFEWRSSLGVWLAGFVINVAREHLRKLPRRGPLVDEAGDGADSDTLARIDLANALLQLPPGFRSVLTLHDLGGFTHEEIAVRLGIQPGTSKSQLARARERMRALLESDEKDRLS